MTPLEALADDYPAWWVDLMGEHNHVGGTDSTRWLLERSGLNTGDLMLDAGAFVGGAARTAAAQGIAAFATDVNADFLATGRSLASGEGVRWVVAASQRLPFADGTFASVWCLDAPAVPREFTRVAAPGATLCLCAEAPNDARGGAEAFFDEWAEYGWSLAAHRALSLDATQTWRRIEAELVGRRRHFEERYGTRSYLRQLDFIAGLVKSYERGEIGHGLFVFRKAT